MTTSLTSDSELLYLAKAVLDGEGFAVEEHADESLNILLAENAWFVLAVTAVATIQDLEEAESRVEAILAARMNTADIGPKRWDAYLVLLTRERLLEGTDSRGIFEINYDTRAIRRIARADVGASLADVRYALAPFVAPIELRDPMASRDALEMLVDALVSEGTDGDVAGRAVLAFRQGGVIDDAI